MFTGIITDIGSVVSKTDASSGYDMSIACGYDMGSVAIGASIACNGICLTVTAKEAQQFSVHASAETARVTTLARWQVGTRLNLERALKLGDELGGHIVQGHVDAVGSLLSITAQGASHRLEIAMPEALAPLVAYKGSIAIDGVSLTVNEVMADRFFVTIIPHSWEHTTLQHLKPGDALNLEADLLARYLLRQQQIRAA